jgi:hypothetical protein
VPNPRLDAAYSTQVKGVRARVEQFTQARFAAGQYRDADLVRFLNEVVPVIKAGQQQVAALTDSYLAQLLTDLLGVPVPPTGLIDTSQLRGITADEVYARPFVTVRTELAAGKDLEAAIRSGQTRLSDLVATDMQLAKTHQTRQAYAGNDRVTGFQRVLTGAKSCALCSIASTQKYRRGDLLPIHPGCDCSTRPLTDTSAPWNQAEADARLEATHQEVQSRIGTQDRGARAPDYRKQLIVHEHGEIGPVLAVRGQHFTGPADI